MEKGNFVERPVSWCSLSGTKFCTHSGANNFSKTTLFCGFYWNVWVLYILEYSTSCTSCFIKI